MWLRLFTLLAFAVVCLAEEANVWVLNRDVLEQRLPIGVTVEELTQVLEKEGISVRFEQWADLTLWKGKRVSISLAPSPFAPYHLWIAVGGCRTLDACSAEDLAELYRAIWMGRKALADITGADGFMIVLTDQARNGKGSRAAGVEIIPSGFGGSGGVMDAVEKNLLNEYAYYNRFPCRNVSQCPETIAAIRAKLQILHPAVQTEQPQGNWSQKLLRHTEALHQSLQSIHDVLAQFGALVEGEMPSKPMQEEKVHEIQIDLHKCAFCNPKVIEKQIVCEWKGVYVLMSHKPVSPYGNFLILPKRHQCALDLTEEEAAASFEAILALKKVLCSQTGSSDWICYIQDGPAVGQTVPHTHLHFFILPDPLKSAISGLQHIHNQRKILPFEEMRAQCERFKPLLLAQLQQHQDCPKRDGG